MGRMKLKVLDLFSGIGGFSLGLERTGGFETVAFCEIEKFPRKVLNKHWSNVPIYEDVRNVTAEKLRTDGIFPDVITGGFPCQDITVAGNQKGIGEGTRSGLWSECARLLGDIRPRYAIFENVTALLSGDNGRWFEQVLWDISQVGYDAEWHCIPASQLGAHHHRDRCFIICYPNSDGHAGMLKQEDGGRDSFREKEKVQQSKGASEAEVLGNSMCKFYESKNDSRISSQRFRAEEIPIKSRRTSGKDNMANTMREGLEGHRQPGKDDRAIQQTAKPFISIDLQSGITKKYWAVEPELGRVANGIPDRAHRIKGLGNAVVPQIPELIGRAILEAENGN